MRHGKISSRLGVKADHRVAMLRNLSIGLIQHGRIKTTLPRAKKLRPFLEPLVTRLKNPTVANLRVAQVTLNNRTAVMELAQRISTVFKDRPGGYLRIMKLSAHRVGDAADMALIEWVEPSLVAAYQDAPAKKAPAKKKAATSKKGSGKKATAKKSAASAEGAESVEAAPKKKSTKKATAKK